jgi:hypothetical protein
MSPLQAQDDPEMTPGADLALGSPVGFPGPGWIGSPFMAVPCAVLSFKIARNGVGCGNRSAPTQESNDE